MAHAVTSFPCLSYDQQQVVARHLRLVRLHLRRRVTLPSQPRRRREAEDLFQEGCIGLIRAVAKHDPRRDGPLAPFALARIRIAIYKAIYEKFATLRVPIEAIVRNKASRPDRHVRHDPSGRRPAPLRQTDVDVELLPTTCGRPQSASGRDASESVTPGGLEAVGHHIREKHQIALGVAIDRVEAQCRRPGVRPVLQALVDERLAVPHEDERTALRAIARRFGVSAGRVQAWERAIKNETRGQLASDGEFGALHKVYLAGMAGQAVRVGELESELARVREGQMRQAFAASDESTQGRMLLRLMRRAKIDVWARTRAIFARLDLSAQRELLAQLRNAE